MKLLKLAAFAVAFTAICAAASPSRAQDWPSKPVKIVVAFAPGGAADLFARLLASEMSTTFRQQFYVENVAGSAGAIGTAQVARARGDGYTLLIGGAGPLLTSPAINPNIGYDTLRDFTHIAISPATVTCSSPTRPPSCAASPMSGGWVRRAL
jgi:tripartite-type tricarboxylate transporter receptor subunit TctC